MNNPFNNKKLRDAFFDEVYDLRIKKVITLGSGPFKEDDFDEFLRSYRISPFKPTEGVEVLIIGDIDWEENEVNRVLMFRAGKTLRAYSQEMFLAYLISGRDPLDEEYEIKLEYAKGHQGLEFLIEIGFDWPTTDVAPNSLQGEGVPFAWQKTSLLGAWGYKVGVSGLSPVRRRKILINAFEQSVPARKLPPSYLVECGRNESSKRLKKMADIIASLCRINKKKSGNYENAIKDYESDLEWLKREVYLPRGFNFSWPETSIA